MSTIGYGDINPISNIEYIFVIIFALMACVIFGYILN